MSFGNIMNSIIDTVAKPSLPLHIGGAGSFDLVIDQFKTFLNRAGIDYNIDYAPTTYIFSEITLPNDYNIITHPVDEFVSVWIRSYERGGARYFIFVKHLGKYYFTKLYPAGHPLTVRLDEVPYSKILKVVPEEMNIVHDFKHPTSKPRLIDQRTYFSEGRR